MGRLSSMTSPRRFRSGFIEVQCHRRLVRVFKG